MHWLGKVWNCMGSWFNFLKQICLTVVEKVLNFQSYMNIQCIFTGTRNNMAKLTCDSLLDLTSNANIVTGSPVPYNRFMKYICQKQFWKQILALLGKKNEYSIFQIHVKILWKEIKFIHIIDLRSGCKKRNDCKNQPTTMFSWKIPLLTTYEIDHLRGLDRLSFLYLYTYECI